MKKLQQFFTNPIIGGVFSLIGVLDILFRIPSKYFSYQISLWVIMLVVGVVILSSYFWKQIKIRYYIKTYTSDSFGGSYIYRWCWVKTSSPVNIYGFLPEHIGVVEEPKLNPNIRVIDFGHHYIQNKDILQEYIMLSLYDKVEDTKQTNLFMQQLHALEAHYSKQNTSMM